MNNKEILRAAIEKAYPDELEIHVSLTSSCSDCGCSTEIDALGTIGSRKYSVEELIFSHDFTKAFWGETLMCSCGHIIDREDGQRACAMHHELYAWQYHLQQIVLEEDPIGYLKQFLK